MLEPAKTVIEICGGVDAVALMVDRDRSRVHRWAYPKSKGGSDGLIPSDIAQTLLDKASNLGLKPEHFFSVRPNPPKQDAA